MFDRKMYKKQARDQLKNHWKVPLLIGLATLGFSVVLYIIFFLVQFNQIFGVMESGDKSTIYVMLLPVWGILLVTLFISGIIYIAASYYYLSFAKDNSNSTFNTFLEGFALWSKGGRGYLWMHLWIVLWTLVFIIPAILGSLVLILVTLGFFLFLAPFLFFIPGMIKATTYSQMFFVMAENPKVGVRKAMRISKEMAKGHTGDLIVMYLSFLGWIGLAIAPNLIVTLGSMGSTFVAMIATISFDMPMNTNAINSIYSAPWNISLTFFSLAFYYIAFLWITPYMRTSFAYAYAYIKQDAINRKVLTYTDFGQKEPVLAVEGAIVVCPAIAGPSVEEKPITTSQDSTPASEEPIV